MTKTSAKTASAETEQSDAIKRKAEEYGEKAQDAVNEAVEQGRQVAEQAKDYASETMVNLERRIREKPLQSAAIAAAAGFVLALLTRR